MTKHNVPDTATSWQPYDDRHGLGQATLANIRMELAQKAMADAVIEAFGKQYENPEWRAMRRRQFANARAEYERAKTIKISCGVVK